MWKRTIKSFKKIETESIRNRTYTHVPIHPRLSTNRIMCITVIQEFVSMHMHYLSHTIAVVAAEIRPSNRM